MDTTKLRLFAAVAGIVFGLGGVFALAVASTLALAGLMGIIGASFTVAALLADLPFDAMKSIIEKRPLTVAALALIAGYSLVRDPAGAARHAQRFMLGLL